VNACPATRNIATRTSLLHVNFRQNKSILNFLPTFVPMHSATFIVLFLNLGTGEIFLIMMFILIFFGADKIPQMARALGKGMREMKNATAEIQREIEKSATEVQRELNIDGETNELKDAVESMKGHIKEGLNHLENHYAEKKELPEAAPEEEKENPLTPPNAVKRS
jgi:sec-independent protein translocase protein TatA